MTNMDNRLDQFFKDKLGEHSREPSSNAWERVKAGASKKNKGVIFFRWAAAIVLTGALITVIVWNRDQANVSVAKSTTPSNDSSEQSLPGTKAPTKAIDRRELPATKTPRRKPSIDIHKQQEQISDPVAETIESITAPEKSEIQAESVKVEIAIAQPRKEKPIVLEYYLGPIKPKEEEKTPEEEAVLMAKEKSGLQKVIEFARETKNGDGLSIRDLRAQIQKGKKEQ